MEAAAVKIIIGLGNPGSKYDKTRHNIGFEVLDRLAHLVGANYVKHLRWQAHIAKHPQALLLKPQTFMNESGRAASAALRFYKWRPEQVLVIYDDVSLNLGTLKFKMKGSSGGHNGIKSLIQHFKSDAFPRLKIGIGASGSGGMTSHVLGKFTPNECPEIEKALDKAVTAVQDAMHSGCDSAANIHNSK